MAIQQESFLRTRKKGRIKMRADNTPLRIKDLNEYQAKIFNMINPNNNNELFISGIRRANVSVGTYVMHTLCQRNHNRICKYIYKSNKLLDDENIFQLAKTINICQLVIIAIKPYTSNIAGFNPIELPSNFFPALQTVNDVPWEFNLAYQFHLMLPDKINGYSTNEIAYNTDIIYSKTIPEWLIVLQNTKCYTQNIINCQTYLKSVEQKAIETSRKVDLLSYCDYRRKMNLIPPKSFYDITKDEKTARRLEEVYKHVENVELYIGMNSEQVDMFPGLMPIFGQTTGTMIRLIALYKLPDYIQKFRRYVLERYPNCIYLIDDFKTNDFINNNIHETTNNSFEFKFKT